MSKEGSSVTEFDWLTESILKELRSMDGEGTTSELRERIGVEDTNPVRYRLTDKLEPQGFVETEQPTGGSGPRPSKVAHLTSRGEGLADQLLDAGDSDDLSISAELDQLKAQVNRLESTLDEQSDVSGDGEFETLLEELNELTHDEGDGWDAESLAEEIHYLRHGMYGMRDYLLDETEMTGDELDAKIESWVEDQ